MSNKCSGHVEWNSTTEFSVSAGDHTVYIQHNGIVSNRLKIALKENRILDLYVDYPEGLFGTLFRTFVNFDSVSLRLQVLNSL